MADQAAAKTSLHPMRGTGTEQIKLFLKSYFFPLHGGGWAHTAPLGTKGQWLGAVDADWLSAARSGPHESGTTGFEEVR